MNVKAISKKPVNPIANKSIKNFKLTLEYDGTDFNGWQIQSQGERTVQGEIQKALLQIFKQEVNVISSGRTDAGVHALGQVINFKIRSRMIPREVQKAMTSFLPSDIVIKDVQEVGLKFHAQYDAISKTYRYTILNRAYASAKERNFCQFYPYKINLVRMRHEAKSFLGKNDFKSFEAADHERAKHSTVRQIKKINIRKKDNWITIDIEADGFLYKMVRNMVGTLLDAGSGRLPKGGVRTILSKRDRCLAGQTAEPQGLCLLEVRY